MSGYVAAVDYGAANTVGLLRRRDGSVWPLLFDGSPLLPSAVYVESGGGRVVAGPDALRRARLDPAGYLRDPKRYVGSGTAHVRDHDLPVTALIGAVFARVGQQAVRTAGGSLPRLVLGYPAGWGERQQAVLLEASVQAGLGVPALVAAPIAAARGWSHAVQDGVPSGRSLLIYEVGACGAEISLVRTTETSSELVASRYVADAGGYDLDRVFVHVVAAQLSADAPDLWWQLSVPQDRAARRQRLDFLEAVRGAREALSREPRVTLHVPVVEREASVTREQFEAAAAPTVARGAEVAAQLLTDAGIRARDLAEVLLIGGAARTPLVADVLAGALGIGVRLGEEPEFAVSAGLVAVADAAGFDAEATVRVDRVAAVSAAAVTAAAGEVKAGTDMPGSTAPPGEAATAVVASAPHASPQEYPLPVDPPSRRRRHAGAAALGLLLVVLLGVAWLQLGRQPDAQGGAPARVPPITAAEGPAGDTSLGQAATASPTAAPVGTSTGSPASRASAAAVGVPLPTAAPSAQSSPPPLSVAVSASPTSGTCATDFRFLARFTILIRAKYHWRWVFVGPNGYTYSSGYHDRDKTGDEQITRKFPASGTYWASVDIQSPVALMSTRVYVTVACATR